MVRGVHFHFDAATLGLALGISSAGPRVYGRPNDPTFFDELDLMEILEHILRPREDRSAGRRGRWIERDLRVQPRVYSHIIGFNILPKGGHRDEPTHFHAYLTYCLDTRQQVCLPYIMLRTMIYVITSRRGGFLPYGRLLTELFASHGVSLEGEEAEEEKWYEDFDWTTITRMGMDGEVPSDAERAAQYPPVRPPRRPRHRGRSTTSTQSFRPGVSVASSGFPIPPVPARGVVIREGGAAETPVMGVDDDSDEERVPPVVPAHPQPGHMAGSSSAAPPGAEERHASLLESRLREMEMAQERSRAEMMGVFQAQMLQMMQNQQAMQMQIVQILEHLGSPQTAIASTPAPVPAITAPMATSEPEPERIVPTSEAVVPDIPPEMVAPNTTDTALRARAPRPFIRGVPRRPWMDRQQGPPSDGQ